MDDDFGVNGPPHFVSSTSGGFDFTSSFDVRNLALSYAAKIGVASDAQTLIKQARLIEEYLTGKGV